MHSMSRRDAMDGALPEAGLTHLDPIDPTGVVKTLSAIIRPGREMPDIVNDVVSMVNEQLPQADDVSITLVRRGKAATVASTGSLSVQLDELQYEEGYGPCLDAGRLDELMHIVDFHREPRWPRYISRAAPLGVRSSLSVPLPVDYYLLGALNVYSLTPDGFDDAAIRLARALAQHSMAALSLVESSSTQQQLTENLQRALESRAVIDQAKGIIMAQRKCSAGSAFEMLRQLSMTQNVKLYELAAQLVASASNHPVPPLEQC
jgi:GAF domain-containing protein